MTDLFDRPADPPPQEPGASRITSYNVCYTKLLRISPDLTRELDLAPGALGFLTGAYFVAFAAMQIPVGMLLDRYGPRRVEPVLLVVAGGGALTFSFAGDAGVLVLGRALIGAGCAACLMAPLKAIATS